MQIKSSYPESGANGQDVSAVLKANSSADGVLSGVSHLIKATASHAGDELAKVRVTLGERVAGARQSVDEMSQAVAGQARRTASATDAYVHEQSWKAIGIGTAIGFVLGAALVRRRRV